MTGEVYSWRRRRRFMYLVCAFCALTIGYVLVADRSSAAAETAVAMAFLALISITASYVFGAAWQDVTSIKAGGAGATLAPRPGPERPPGGAIGAGPAGAAGA